MRKHIENFVINAFPFLISLVPTILTVPIFLKYLGASEMGLYYLYLTITGIGGMFDLGISQSLIKYIAAYRTKSTSYVAQIIYSSRIASFILLSICFIVFLIYMSVATALHFEVKWMLSLLCVVGFVLQYLLNLELAIFKGYEKFSAVARYEVIQKIGFCSLGIGVAILYKDVKYVILMHVFVTAFLLLFNSRLKWRKNEGYKQRSIKFNLAFFKKVLFDYSKWVFLQNLIGFLNGNLDTLLVASFVNIKSLASYNTSFNLSTVIQGFAAKGLSYLLPYASKNTDQEVLRKFFVNGNLILSSILGLCYPVAVLLAPIVIKWYLKSDSTVANQVISYFDYLLICALFACTSLLSWHLFNGMGEIKINTTVPLIFNIIGLMLMVVFGYLYGVWGIIIAKMVSSSFSVVVRTITYNAVFKKRDYLIGLKLASPLIICVLVVEFFKWFFK
ncbi:lipopolysaccharide biosynthesis protein [Pedobacter sp. MW01-1-1]|uniref:lipopolysaccharide biosynthesis protein n=1 Tax=Pedobacter sp. MW01-1-1 TaxID=3383027 RepID=UPI003FEDAE34